MSSSTETATERWDGSASRYSDSQYASACVLDRNDCEDAGDMSAKQRYSLPVANPGSSWSESPDRGGVAAAAQRLSQTSAGAECKAAAAKRLMRCYSKLGMEPPESMVSMAGRAEIKEMIEEAKDDLRDNRPPRDELVRAMPERIEVREAENGDGPTLHGHAAVFNEWSEIESMREGHFMERIAPGAFKKTISESNGIKVTFQHGHDPTLGDQALGKIRSLKEDDTGLAYEVNLFDGVPPLLMSGLRAGEYGSSFRFRVTREDFNREPEKSDFNPGGIPERTVKEAEVFEFGPVTYPAYAGATAGVRSITDEYIFDDFVQHPDRLRDLIESVLSRADEVSEEVVETSEVATDDSPEAEESAGAEPHPSPTRRESRPIYGGATDKTPLFGQNQRRLPKWQL